MKPRIIAIGELGEYIHRSLSGDPILNNIYVEGELSNLKVHSSGNVYFTLKDESVKVRCVLFNDFAEEIFMTKTFQEGDRIICRGDISFYKKEGVVSFLVNDMYSQGVSLSYQNFLALKKRLQTEGYFDEGRKKKLKPFPSAIGLVTSVTGATIKDIYQVIARRYPAVEIIVYPSLVQGNEAPGIIAEGIRVLDLLNPDVIILARGGGSSEELDAFNSKIVADAIFEAKTPIISAIGHETDFTIADFVSDVRASTPSVAAELAVPNLQDVRNSFSRREMQLHQELKRKIDIFRNKIFINAQQLELLSPQNKMIELAHRMQLQGNALKNIILDILRRKETALEEKERLLTRHNPYTILDLGGAMIYDESGIRINDSSIVTADMILKIVMKNKFFKVKVLKDEL